MSAPQPALAIRDLSVSVTAAFDSDSRIEHAMSVAGVNIVFNMADL